MICSTSFTFYVFFKLSMICFAFSGSVSDISPYKSLKIALISSAFSSLSAPPSSWFSSSLLTSFLGGVLYHVIKLLSNIIVVFKLKLSLSWLMTCSASKTGVVFKSMTTISDSRIDLLINLTLGFKSIFLTPEGGFDVRGSAYLNVPEMMFGSSECL